VGARTAEVAVQGDAVRCGRGVRGRERDPEDRVRAELRLVERPIELEHPAVDLALVERVHTHQLRRDDLVDVAACGQHALPPVALLVAVTELERLVLSGGRAGRDRGTSEGAVVEVHVDLDGRVAPRVEDLARTDGADGRHGLRF
jgi:hypothetical protein